MAATIKIKNSSTASAVPTSSDLVQGELAVNVTDKRIFTENASGTVVELGTNPSILTLPDGSASAPTLTNDGDTNTGLFFPAADTVGITTGGTERLRVDSAGNLGLGVTPSTWSTGKAQEFNTVGNAVWSTGANDLRLLANIYYNGGYKYATTASASMYQVSGGYHSWYVAASGTAGNAITFTQAMTLDASGNLIVGGTTTFGGGAWWTKSFTVNGSTGSVSDAGVDIIGYRAGDGDVGGIGFLNAASSNARIATIYGERSGANNSGILGFHTMNAGTSAERARITSSGDLLVGTTSQVNSGKVCFVGDFNSNNGIVLKTTYASTGSIFALFANSAGSTAGYITQNGTTTVQYVTSSDYRLKENIAPMTGALAKVAALKPCTYTWKEDGSVGQGFIAHELQEVVPDAVAGNKDDVYEDGSIKPQGIDTSFLVATLTAAIQELNAKFEAYKASHP